MCVAASHPTTLNAAPGEATRLAGAEAQGPATASVTAIHHNPAMLTGLPGFNFHTQLRGGIDHLLVRRFAPDNLGQPTTKIGGRTGLVNPTAGYFVGASFLLDPIAVGVGVYTHETRIRINSAPLLRYHLAPTPDLGCAVDRGKSCPSLDSGGAVQMRTDFTLALAYAFNKVSVGIAAHFPRSRIRFAHDNDTGLTSTGESVPGCGVDGEGIEDPRCAERIAFHGVNRWRLFGLNQRPSSPLDLAVTFGISFAMNNRVTLGARFRSRPLRNRGVLTLHGEALVCTPPDAVREANVDQLPACTDSSPVDATVNEEIPREGAIGASIVLGGRKRWQVDTNFFWIDRCPGPTAAGGCGGRDALRLSLVGLERSVSVLPESLIYRGFKDIYGAEIWARYDLQKRLAGPSRLFCDGTRRRDRERPCTPRVDLILGGSVRSPGVRPGAITAMYSDGWTLSTSLGAIFEIPSRSSSALGTWSLVPGYGLDFVIPTRVGPGGRDPAYDPNLALQFEDSGGDINATSANAVLQGRGRPTNAATYTGILHTMTLGLRWGESR